MVSYFFNQLSQSIGQSGQPPRRPLRWCCFRSAHYKRPRPQVLRGKRLGPYCMSCTSLCVLFNVHAGRSRRQLAPDHLLQVGTVLALFLASVVNSTVRTRQPTSKCPTDVTLLLIFFFFILHLSLRQVRNHLLENASDSGNKPVKKQNGNSKKTRAAHM